ncbi:Brf1-like TBP-binding domain-containing protein [Paraphoma chrysanthemicola]|uniref:Brf1-like TBP-binding domain-containing protein n=1 Tax=Paraphoma chrysanthemicola TaxID=798071 RepID=A0A8K0R9J9_9PLEO|nr:Brf1-like TBP-binding domain-containing protein [Paraphoma chrysanthemicola]
MPAVVGPGPRAPRVRLSSVNPDIRGGPAIRYQSEATKLKALPPPPKKPAKRYTCCANPNISTDEGSVLCYNCGTVHEDQTIVSEVTFGETAGGAAMVEGGFIGENQRHANSMGGTMRGIGGMPSREQAEMMGRSEIEKIGGSLYVRQSVREQAFSWYKLASNYNFVQGRRMRNVAAVTLYVAARRQPDNTLMLMDLAEKIQVNVWNLGDTYKTFLKMLRDKDPAQLVGNKAIQEIEPLMLKYCRKLEFAEDSHKVAQDACSILRRMSRDWMVQGRQPAGLCGACIILAARMNNFRRTVREVVYVVKVADSTINSRLYEYKQTPSSALTVNQFRQFGEQLKVTVQPPSIWRREKKEERREKRKAADADPDREAVPEHSGDSEQEAGSSATPSAPKRASKRRRNNNGDSQPANGQGDSSAQDGIIFDGNGEAVLESLDAVMADAQEGDPEDGAFVIPKKRGRPRKRERVVVAPEDLEIEQELEAEVTDAIKDWEVTFKDILANDNHPLYKATGWTAQQMARAQLDQRDVPVSDSPDIGEDEFDDDPDVATCILGPDEVRIKERIWVAENEDWLRAQQKKLLEAELEAAEDKPKKPKQKRKHHQMGDGSVLEGQPAASAAEAAHKMLKKRGKAFSNHLNYDRLKSLFAPLGSSASSPSAGGSGQGASPSVDQVQTPPVIPVSDVDAEGEEEEEEEYEEPQQEVEEEDLEHQYRSDEDDYNTNYDDDY